MSIHNEDTARLERITFRPVQPVLSQEERLARRSLVAISLVVPVGVVLGDFIWHVIIALMVMHVMVR